MATKPAALLLQKQMMDIAKNASESFSVGLIDDDIYKWEVFINGPGGTPYEGGFFKAKLEFSDDFPMKPPKMRFISKMWHPNIHHNGAVCISILHEGEDTTGYEQPGERWSPVQTVETILISVISMLADPNDQSPANVDAAIQFRDNNAEFKKEVRKTVRKSIDDLT